MSITTVTSSGQQSITVSGAQNIKITNLNVTSADTEFSHALTTNLRQLMVRSRVGADIQYCFVTGETNTKYMTISKGSVLELIDLDFSSKTLYLQADKTGIVEIQELY